MDGVRREGVVSCEGLRREEVDSAGGSTSESFNEIIKKKILKTLKNVNKR